MTTNRDSRPLSATESDSTPQDRHLRAFAYDAIKRAQAKFYESDIRSVRRLAERMEHLGWECVWCGGPFESIDHVTPLQLGGRDMLDNLVPSCRTCNSTKGALPPERWIAGDVQGNPSHCGTPTGYRKHKSKGTQPCRPCLDANNAFTRASQSALKADRKARTEEAKRLWAERKR